MALYEVGNFDAALAAAAGGLRRRLRLPGAPRARWLQARTDCTPVGAAPVSRVVDTTGAGDLYAAGFLLGLARGFDLARCGRLAALAAGEIIGHYGARPEADIAPFVEASRHPL